MRKNVLTRWWGYCSSCCSHSSLVPLLSLFLLGAGLRVYHLDAQSLWHDEIHTYRKATNQIAEVNIPPLYHSMMQPLVKLGHDEWLLRLPSVLFGSASILLFYLIVCHWLGGTVGLTSTLMMAISPFHIWYSQEARPYALLVFLALLSLWFLQLLLKNPRRSLLQMAFIIVTAATFYCHTIAAPFIVFLSVIVLFMTPHEAWKDWFKIFCGIVFLMTPAMYRLITIQPNASADSFRFFDPLSLAYVVWVFSTGYSLGPTVSELHRPDRISIVFAHFPLILVVMAFFSVLFLLGVIKLQKQDRLTFYSASLWFAFSLAFAVLGSIFTVHPFNVRYAILSFPPFIIFLAVGVHSVKTQWRRVSVLGGVVILSMLALNNYFFAERYHRDDIRAAAHFLAVHSVPGDLVIASAAYLAPDIQYYYSSDDIKIVGYPARQSLAAASGHTGKNSDSAGVFFVGQRSKIEGDFERMTAGRERFWLFLSRTYHSDPDGYIRAFCEANYNRQLYASWSGVELILYAIEQS